MNITCDLYSQWIKAIRNEMTNSGLNPSGMADQDCAIRWQSWRRRIVPTGRRAIHKARGFNCPPQLQQGLADFEHAIRSGLDIWPWQSKLIDRPTFEDTLFNDFRVIHFHMGQGFHPSGYINRTGELLFATVDAESIYEIGVYNHGDWFEFDILDIVDNNWPALLDPFTIQGLDVQNCPTTREEVKALREANVITVFKLTSGRIIAPPGGGVATDGTSIEAVQVADYWAKIMRNGSKAIEDDIRKQVLSGSMPIQDYEVLLHITDSEIAGIVKDQFKWKLWERA